MNTSRTVSQGRGALTRAEIREAALRAPRACRGTLTALALFADAEGQAWPSVAALAEVAGEARRPCKKT